MIFGLSSLSAVSISCGKNDYAYGVRILITMNYHLQMPYAFTELKISYLFVDNRCWSLSYGAPVCMCLLKCHVNLHDRITNGFAVHSLCSVVI